MIDKVQKIREEVARIQLYTQSEVLKQVLDYIDKVQKEPVSKEIGDYDHKAVMESLHPELKEEPVSEDLEEEIEEYWKNAPTGTVYFPMWEHFQIIAHHFVEWGKKQAEIEIQTQSMAVTHGCPKEPVNEDLNTESMIESYKQRLISQANGMKNSPLIDMCLVSYKHGINETLDTLKLSNIERIVKNWEEPTTEDLGEYINELSKQFPEVSFAKLSRIAVRVAKWQKEQFEKDYTDLYNGIATAKGIAVAMAYDKGVADAKEQMMKNVWKPADGDDLPEYDREVIAILDYDFGHYKVVYAHRPNPNGWDGTNIDTGEKEHFESEIYDKGGWNQPHVLYWLDTKLPYEEK